MYRFEQSFIVHALKLPNLRNVLFVSITQLNLGDVAWKKRGAEFPRFAGETILVFIYLFILIIRGELWLIKYFLVIF